MLELRHSLAHRESPRSSPASAAGRRLEAVRSGRRLRPAALAVLVAALSGLAAGIGMPRGP